MMSTSLLPQNATTLELAVEGAAREILDNIIVDIDKINRVQETPSSFLPFIAWGLSVDNWSSNFSDTRRRLVISTSIRDHSIKGTIGALKQALEQVGAVYDIDENPNGVRYTATIEVINDDTFGLIRDEELLSSINNVNRLSVHFILLTPSTNFTPPSFRYTIDLGFTFLSYSRYNFGINV